MTMLDADEKIYGRLGPDRKDITQAKFLLASATTHTIIAAPAAGYRIVVTGWYLNAEDVTRFGWKIGADIFGEDHLTEAGKSYSDRGCPRGPVFVLPEATAFQLVTPAAVVLRGYVTYFVEAV